MAVRLVLRNILFRENSLLKIQQPQLITPLFSGHFQSFLPNEGQKRLYSKYRKKVPPVFPKLFKSGDMIKREPLPNDTVKFWYQDIKELENVPDKIQQLFTVEYANRLEIRDHEHHVLLERIQETLGPDAIFEKRIAYLTLRIRALKKHLTSYRQDKVSKSILSEKIAKRRQMLKKLKRLNTVNFRWLTRELGLSYAPVSKYIYWPLTRKGKRKKAAYRKGFKMKMQKLDILREQYEKERSEFDIYKAKTLTEIEKDLKDLNLTIDDVYNPTALSKKERVKKEKVKFKGRIWY